MLYVPPKTSRKIFPQIEKAQKKMPGLVLT